MGPQAGEEGVQTPSPTHCSPVGKAGVGLRAAHLRAGREGEEEASGLRVGGQRP